MKVLKETLRKYSIKGISVLLSISVIISVFASALAAQIVTRADTNLWDGSVAEGFSSGVGTEEKPFKISNGAELRYMFEEYVVNADNSSVYFELTNDIDLNNKDWTDTVSQNNYFSSKFDGKGYVISNLKIPESSSNIGLFHQLGNGAEIKNLIIDGAVVNGTGNHAAVLASRVVASATANISNCVIKNATVTSAANAGGFIATNAGGNGKESYLNITNCGFVGTLNATTTGGICANSQTYGHINASKCYSSGADAITTSNSGRTTVENVYTTYTDTTKATYVSAENMQGENAKTNLVGFDFDEVWKATNTYPEIRFYRPDNAVAGDAWLGGVATKFAGGEGTEESPYQIATGEQLRYMFEEYVLNADNSSVYFELISDINLNNKDWTDTVSQNNYFSSKFDGKGYVISNLIIPESSSNIGLFHQLGNGAEIKNLIIDGAVVNGTGNHAAVMASRVVASATVNVSNCVIKNATVTSAANAGGFIATNAGGSGKESYFNIQNCGFVGTLNGTTTGGICANSQTYGHINASKCYSSGADAITTSNSGRTTVENVYTTYTDTTKATYVSAENMQGENAKINLIGFDFDSIWETTETYPAIRLFDPDRVEAGVAWSGEVATKFAGGEGTEELPYQIATGEQLRYMFEEYVANADNSSLYFELTSDINLNNKDWTDTVSQNNYFSSKFNGNGYTISNLIIPESSSNIGLFHQLGNGAEIKNLIIDGAVINGTGNHAAVIASRVVASATVNVSNCIIKNATVTSAANAGGFIATNAGGNGKESYLNIDNCGFVGTLNGTTTGGICANSQTYGHINASKCYSNGADAITTSNNGRTSVEYVYTTYADTTKATYVSVENMQGENAKTNLIGFDFNAIWKCVVDDTPTLRFGEKISNKDIWNGVAATDFAEGTGEKESPYKISNASELYLLVTEYSTSGLYFELTNDIYLNNVNDSEWKTDSPNEWVSGFNSTAFTFKFDGKGYAVYGLYVEESSYSGLFPALGDGAEIRNVSVRESYIKGSSNAGAIAGRLKSGKVTISGSSADSSVVLSANTVGGIVGANAGELTIKNSWFVTDGTNLTEATGKKAGIIGDSWGKVLTVLTSYSVGIDAFDNLSSNYTTNPSAYLLTINGVYTTDETTEKATFVSDENIRGNNAKINLVEFDFENTWNVVDGEYPVLTYNDEIIEEENGNKKVWNGEAATSFAGGNGEKDNPFKISNASELYLLVTEYSTSGKYFELTNDIYLNDVSNDSWLNVPNEWVSGFNSTAFTFKFDGKGYTVHGVYVNGSSYSGLFPALGDGAEIKNVSVRDSFIMGDSNAGAIAGRVKSGAVLISGCSADSSVLLSANTVGGIIAANAGELTIKNCWFTIDNSDQIGTPGKKAGIIADSWGKALTVLTSYSVGIDAFDTLSSNYQSNPSSYSLYISGVYTTDEATENAIFVSDENMRGKNAETSLSKFDFKNVWKSVEGKYPVLTYNDEIIEEVKDYIWDGKTATEFSGGAGTKTDPYQISNGAELRLMAETYIKEEDNSDIYFILTEDIYLNDVSLEDWTDNPKKWKDTWGQKVYFSSDFNGNGHTIYGLYIPDSSSNVALFHQLGDGANIHNLNIKNSYVNGTGNHAAVIASRVIPGATAEINLCLIENCYVKSSKNTGGFVATVAGGSSGASTLKIKNCGFNGTLVGENTAGICANTQNSSFVNASYCYSAGVDAFAFVTNGSIINCTSVYTTDNTPVKDEGTNFAAKFVDASSIIGDKAVVNLIGFDFDNVWITVSNGYPVIRPNPRVVEKVRPWDGRAAKSYAGGSGTETDPYQIANAAQLYKMVSEHMYDENPQYFVLISDIIINDTTDSNWHTDDPMSWITGANSSTKICEFKSKLDGKGHYIYGLYTIGGFYNGLIPALGDGASISNIHIRDSVIKSSSYAGAIAGRNYQGSAIIYGCSADDTVIVNGKTAGGLVGGNAGTLTVEDSYFSGTVTGSTMQAGICANSWGVLTIKRCYTVGSVVFTSSKTSNIITDVYSDVAQENGVIVIPTDKMKGENAKTSMPGLTWGTAWFTVDNDFPHLNVVIKKYNNGKKGEIWSGECANKYAGGSGTKEDPYQIETGEQLYLMVSQNCVTQDKGEYYILTADIFLNDTSKQNWTQSANEWFVAISSNAAFKGNFDGNGHVVYGLYVNSDDDMAFAGLIPVIGEGAVVKNVGISKSYISNNYGGSSTYAAAITGYISLYKTENPIIPVISCCFADPTVTIEANYAGGIVGGVPAPVKIENCFFTGKLAGRTHRGAIIGNIWSTGSQILSCYAITADMDGFIGGKMLNYAATDENLYCRNNYCFASTFYGGTEPIDFTDMHGKAAKNAMKGFDFNKIWSTVTNGTPVLRIFGSDAFSDTSKRYVTVSFVTNCEDLNVEPQNIAIGEKVELPKLSRYGYRLVGWYVYKELDIQYPEDSYPICDMLLYAKWEKVSIKQDFENYPNTKYDIGDDFEYFRPGTPGYDANKVFEGASSLHRIGASDKDADFLLFYEDELEIGREYEMTYRVYTDSPSAQFKLSLVYLTWPDINAENLGVEEMLSTTLEGDVWTEYTFTFIAKSKWVSIRTSGGESLYFDDFVLVPTENFDEQIANTYSDKNNTNENSTNIIWIILIVAGIAVVVIGTVLFIYIVKKRKNN